jgi:hypothetical protein
MVNACGWRSFKEHKHYGKSVEECIGFRSNDEVTLTYGWGLATKPEIYDLLLPSRGVRMLQTKAISWATPKPIPPLRLFFQILGEDSIHLLHIEEDK